MVAVRIKQAVKELGKKLVLGLGGLAVVAGLALTLPSPSALAAEPAAAVARSVDINKADAKTIAQVLHGIGLKKAQAIISYREQIGGFTSVEQLVEVKGIGEKVLEKNQGRIALK